MSVARACLPCRTAKARCDLVRPVCGRCGQRGVQCHGFPGDEGFVFRDERSVAQRNSERARRERRGAISASALFEVVTSGPQQNARTHIATVVPDEDLKQLYSWLIAQAMAEVPGPLKRDPCARAVDHFFINWTLHPSNDGTFPGYLHTLPGLYAREAPESALWYAVRAIAAADKRHYHDGDIPFDVKARRNYGSALAKLRQLANDEQTMTKDCSLAALMLVDTFEEIYLARSEPLGLHSQAVKHVLQLRGIEQFFDKSRFAMWRVAHDRLQARQIIMREGPTPEQILWFSRLDPASPDLHVCIDKLRINILCAQVRRLVEGEEGCGSAGEGPERARTLANEIMNLLASIESWAGDLPTVWKAAEGDPDRVNLPRETCQDPGRPIPQLAWSRVLAYRHVTVAYCWSFFASSQIVLRESLIEVLEHGALLEQREPNAQEAERIIQEQVAIDQLSESVLESAPQLMGIMQQIGGASLPQQGVMVGRFYMLFSLWVIQSASHTSMAHKDLSTRIVEWITSRHGLD